MSIPKELKILIDILNDFCILIHEISDISCSAIHYLSKIALVQFKKANSNDQRSRLISSGNPALG